MQTKKLKFVVGTVVILGAVLTLAITGMEESKAYYQTVPELKAMGVKAEGRRIRVAGDVVVGSIERHEEGVVTFVIDYEGETLPVRYVGRGPLPDTLVDRRSRRERSSQTVPSRPRSSRRSVLPNTRRPTKKARPSPNKRLH